MKKRLGIGFMVGAALLLLAPASVAAKHARSKGVKLECQNKGYGRRAGCTLYNGARKTRHCKYTIYYSWKPGSRTKYEKKKGSGTIAAGRKVTVLNGHGWTYRWSSLYLSCK